MPKYTPYMPDGLQILNKITLHYTCNYVLLTKKKVKMAGHWSQCQPLQGYAISTKCKLLIPIYTLGWERKMEWSNYFCLTKHHDGMIQTKIRSLKAWLTDMMNTYVIIVTILKLSNSFYTPWRTIWTRFKSTIPCFAR